MNRNVIIACLGTRDGPVLNPFDISQTAYEESSYFVVDFVQVQWHANLGPGQWPQAHMWRQVYIISNYFILCVSNDFLQVLLRLEYNPASVRSRHSWVKLLDPGH